MHGTLPAALHLTRGDLCCTHREGTSSGGHARPGPLHDGHQQVSSPQASTAHWLSCKASYHHSSDDQPRSLTLLKCSLLRRSPAVVVAYLMKHRRWRLTEAYKWVKEHRPETELTSGAPP